MLEAMKAALLLVIGSSMMFGQFNELNRLTASSSGHYSEAQAHAVAVELLGPLTPDRTAVQALAGWLARKQLDWQDGSIHALDSAKLLAGVNRELGLENSPDLQLREDELQKMSTFLKSRVPGLAPGGSTGQMSPFEAFFVVAQLVRIKMAWAPIPPDRPVRARLAARPYNPADHPFLTKVMQAWKKWPTAAAGQRTLERILEQSQ
jgi:hypothetical protein